MPLTEAEIELRKSGIGSSDIAAVAGVNPFKTSIDVFQEKTQQVEQFTGDWTSEVGHQLEPLIGKWYKDEVGASEIVAGNTMVHKDEPWIMATPDYFVTIPVSPKRLLEIKNVGFRVAHHWIDGPPEYVACQVHWQQEVTGIHFADVAASISAKEPMYWQIEDSPEIRKYLKEIARDFWFEHVLKNIPPTPDNTEEYQTYLQKSFNNYNSEIIDGDVSLDKWFDKRSLANEIIKEKQAEVVEAENHILAAIGSNLGIKTDSWKATWKKNSTGSVSWKSVAVALGASKELIEKHTSKPSRILRVKGIK